MACADYRNEICSDWILFGKATWLAEAAGAIPWMIVASGRHELGFLTFEFDKYGAMEQRIAPNAVREHIAAQYVYVTPFVRSPRSLYTYTS